MNFYLIENAYPTVKLRHYKNNRTARYTCNLLNSTEGNLKYSIITDETPVRIARLNRN